MTKSEIVEAINLAHEATEASVVGKIERKDDAGNPTFNTLAYNVFQSVLSALLPRISVTTASMTATMKEPQEPWQEE